MVHTEIARLSFAAEVALVIHLRLLTSNDVFVEQYRDLKNTRGTIMYAF